MLSISETMFIDAKIEIAESKDDWMPMDVLLFSDWEGALLARLLLDLAVATANPLNCVRRVDCCDVSTVLRLETKH